MLIALLCMVSGCSLLQEERSGPAGSTDFVWDRLASQLTAALTTKDEAAYLAGFTGAAVDQQRIFFRNVAKVPFDEVSFQPIGRPDANGQLKVAFVHRIRNVDTYAVAERYVWTTQTREESKNQWRMTVSHVAGDTAAPRSYYPAPWDVYDDIEVASSANAVVIASAANAALVKQHSGAAQKAAETNLALWSKNVPPGTPTAQGFVVVLEPDRKVFDAMYREGSQDGGSEAGVAIWFNRHVDDAYTPAPDAESEEEAIRKGPGQGVSRIVVDTSTSFFTAKGNSPGVPSIFEHEIAHALVAPLSGTRRVPEKWLVEGFAQYIEVVNNPQTAKALEAALQGYPFGGHLPDDTEFEDADARVVAASYALGRLAVQFVAEKYGARKAFAMVIDQYTDPRRDVVKASIEKATGMPYDEFEPAWEQWVRAKIPAMGAW
ncbi:hypothetical protein [Yinghuangia soli]|uniref:Peptidase MA-like domain-containing protein n=1 Tax=Yinghuangia soli TaxID=2908204 RepID=A0AA41Q1V6_9ACTN|nr:hypothetical protein [Yinghuangia soli]MCF2528909.1 hypothetical protein [Yinghuangia soli]